jgi:hypothetical protein
MNGHLGALKICLVDLAVYRGSEIIQSASDFFNYCENHLKDTKSTYCKRRIFRYVEKN